MPSLLGELELAANMRQQLRGYFMNCPACEEQIGWGMGRRAAMWTEWEFDCPECEEGIVIMYASMKAPIMARNTRP